MAVFEKGSRPPFLLPSLCAILDADVAAGAALPLVDLAVACLAGGARFLQIRAKTAPGGWFLETATTIGQLARRVGALVVINDRADIARLAGADGVHLGQTDLSPAAARAMLGEAAIVGLSTHTPDQIDAALDQPIAYLAVGPVFRTSTKATGYEALGLDGVRQAAGRARERGIPVVAIGGITLDRAPSVIDAGAASVAVIGDLLATGDPEARVRAYIERLSR